MVVEMSELEQRAKEFATKAHGSINQKRKWTGEDYIVHPAAVAEIVRSVGGTDELIAAAWLHDTVEDTPVTLDDIRANFGDNVAELVEMLTDVSKGMTASRKIRKALDRDHLATASASAKTVKLADLIDNTGSIVELGGPFAVIYLKEKLELLAVLKEGNRKLWDFAKALAEYELKKLGEV